MREQLFIDCVGHTNLVIEEASGNVLRFRGKFQEADRVNKNNRIYPFAVLDKNVKNLEEAIKKRSLVGECDHPNNQQVSLGNVSHLVTKLWWEGNTLMGEGEILNTPSGKVVKSLLESGIVVGISSRGVGNGTNNNDGVLVIGESYRLISWDLVQDPSTPLAHISLNKKEAVEYNSLPSPATKTFDPNLFISYFGEVVKKKVENFKNTVKN